MNNLPRFRAWHKEEKRILHIHTMTWGCQDDLDFVYACFHPYDCKHYDPLDLILMQWTGLQDKNGKDIYEGDIIEVCTHFEDRRNQRLYYVYRDIINGIWSLRITNEPHKDMLSYYKFCQPVTEGSIIVGNIYENPELLKDD